MGNRHTKKENNHNKLTSGKIFWIIIAVVGSAWLVYSGLLGYIKYWANYSLSENFFDHLISVSAFELVKFIAGCTFFTIMMNDLNSLERKFSVVGFIASLVTGILYILGLINGINSVFFSDTVGTFLERITSVSLARYVAYSVLLIGFIMFFVAGMHRSRSGKAVKTLLILGALIIYAVSLIEGITDSSSVSVSTIFSYTFADCLAYIAIAISVF